MEMTLRQRAIESAKARLVQMVRNLDLSEGNEATLAKRKRQVDVASYTLCAVNAFESEHARWAVLMQRFFALRQRLFDLLCRVDEGHHKHYEGELSLVLSFPNFFESKENPEPEDYATIQLRCYLLGDNRYEEFIGPSLTGAMDEFEAWLSDREAEEREG